MLQSRLYKHFGRAQEARDAARLALMMPLWSLGELDLHQVAVFPPCALGHARTPALWPNTRQLRGPWMHVDGCHVGAPLAACVRPPPPLPPHGVVSAADGQEKNTSNEGQHQNE